MANSSCPPPEHLRLLLIAENPGPDQADLVAHLDSCPVCQRTLEELAGATHDLLGAARGVGRKSDTHDAEDSLRRVLTNIESRVAATLPVNYSPAGGPSALPNGLTQLDGYQITGTLGHGAMGEVLAAFDPALHRRVAIKILAANRARDPVARERFAREARAAAAVKHEHVVTIHAVREVDGLPYLVMEYLAGGSLQDYLERHGTPAWQITARLGAEIAEGLAAAHAAGLIHRDIKPSNILLEPSSSDVPGMAKIADFGLARVGDESRLTESGILAGTPMYMAPEQALGETLDERADLFSLGSVLYTLCTGQEPFQGGNPMAVLRQVCEAKPKRIQQLNPAVPTWLAEVVERLHARRPADRFASAAEVAALLRFNLDHPDYPRPVPKASPSTRSRRNKAWLVAALLIGLLLIAWVILKREPGRVAPLSPRATLQGHTGPLWAVAFSPDGRTVVTGGADTTLRFWDTQTGQSTGMLTSENNAILSIGFALAGKAIITGHGDGSLHVWDAVTHREQKGFPHAGGSMRRLAVSDDGKMLAVCSKTQGVELWDIEKRTLRQNLPGHSTTLLALALAPQGNSLATGDTSGQVRVYDPRSGSERAFFQGDALGLRALAFSPDGLTLASAGVDSRDVKLWELGTHHLVATLTGYEDLVFKLVYSSKGDRLASGGRDGMVKVWDVPSERLLLTTHAHQNGIWSLAFSPDGQTLATVGEDRLGKLWDLSGLP